MAAHAAVSKPNQADAYAPAQEQFDSIKSHLHSAQAKKAGCAPLLKARFEIEQISGNRGVHHFLR
ncbi:MAG: hypothetical protein SF339_02390 [Blastocatellia bacterium]|nr:hypothetical protein [Blastocatellia bacterium]